MFLAFAQQEASILRNRLSAGNVDQQGSLMTWEDDRMIETIKVSLLTMMLTAWSAIAMAQTTPGGPPGSPGSETSSPTTTAPATTGAVGGEGMNWLWIVIAVVVIAGLLFYFLGRNRSTRI